MKGWQGVGHYVLTFGRGEEEGGRILQLLSLGARGGEREGGREWEVGGCAAGGGF